MGDSMISATLRGFWRWAKGLFRALARSPFGDESRVLLCGPVLFHVGRGLRGQARYGTRVGEPVPDGIAAGYDCGRGIALGVLLPSYGQDPVEKTAGHVVVCGDGHGSSRGTRPWRPS